MWCLNWWCHCNRCDRNNSHFFLIVDSFICFLLFVVDVLRDVKAMAVDKRVTTQKILRFTAQTSGYVPFLLISWLDLHTHSLLHFLSPSITHSFRFFSIYHGIRKALHLYYPQPVEENLFLAASITLVPLGLIKSTRAIFPYGVLLVFLDAFNEITDQYK